jgi:FdhD protein
VRLPLPALPPVTLTAQALLRAQRCLHQPLQALTGATHAAAWCTPDGKPRLLREDIGRHNALDKLIGALHRASVAPREGFVCITSRASFEMVQKSARAGIAALAAVSAPTTLAVELARQCGQSLAGFVRGEGLVAYTFAERLGLRA